MEQGGVDIVEGASLKPRPALQKNERETEQASAHCMFEA